MNKKIIKLACGLALLGAAVAASAQPVTYTGTGVMTGSFNGTNFTDTPFTITTTGDLGNIIRANTTDPAYDTPIYTYALVGTTTIDIDGFGLATFNGGDLFGVSVYNEAATPGGNATINFLDFGSVVDVVDNNYSSVIASLLLNPSDINYDLSTATTLVGQTGSDGEDYTTDLGDLSILYTGSDSNPNMTFTASIAAVPEPSALALAGAGGLSALAIFRRRK